MAKKNKPTMDFTAMAQSLGAKPMSHSTWALVEDRLPTFISQFDKMLGGGFPFGRIIEIAAENQTGKTQLAMYMTKVAYSVGCIPVYIDVEASADSDRMEDLGIDTSKVYSIEPTASNPILTIEYIGSVIEGMIDKTKEIAPDSRLVFFWDSLGASESQMDLDTDLDKNEQIGVHARSIKRVIKRIAPKLASSNHMLVCVNQVREDKDATQERFKKIKTTGGKTFEHAASTRVELKMGPKEYKGTGADRERLGHIIRAKTFKNKVAPPDMKSNLFLTNVDGVGYELNLIKQAVEIKIAKGGDTAQSYEYVDLNGEKHSKRKANFLDWLKNDPQGNEIRKELFQRITLHEFPDSYPPLGNKNLDVSGWTDLEGLKEKYEEKGITNHATNTEEVPSDIENIEEELEKIDEE